MDFPVEATIHLNVFEDRREVLKILESHGFKVSDLRPDEARVSGSFSNLRAVKAQLEQLHEAQTQTSVPSSSQRPVSSGAVPKNYNGPDGDRRRLGSGSKPQGVSPSSADTPHSRPTPPQYRPACPPGSQEIFKTVGVDRDVFMYADRFRKRDINNILQTHNVEMVGKVAGEIVNVTLKGRSAGRAAGELQSFFNHLTTSLRTQEVLQKDMDREGKAVLRRIQKEGNVYRSVLVCQMNDRLHLVGPSRESYELQQKLLGGPGEPSGCTGWRGGSRRKSSSQPAPVAAARYKDHKQEAGRGASWRRAQSSETSTKNGQKIKNFFMNLFK